LELIIEPKCVVLRTKSKIHH